MKVLAQFADNYDKIKEAEIMGTDLPDIEGEWAEIGMNPAHIEVHHLTPEGNIRVYMASGERWTIKNEKISGYDNEFITINDYINSFMK